MTKPPENGAASWKDWAINANVEVGIRANKDCSRKRNRQLGGDLQTERLMQNIEIGSKANGHSPRKQRMVPPGSAGKQSESRSRS